MKYKEILDILISLINFKNKIGCQLTDEQFEELNKITKQLEQLMIRIDDIDSKYIKSVILFLIGIIIKIFLKSP
jgi:hypothetical protein